MFELCIAIRHITSNKKGTAFTLFTVAVAVGVIVMSLGLTSGSLAQIVQNTVEKNPHVVILPKPGEDYIYLYRSLSRYVSQYPGVIASVPRLTAQGAVRYRDQVQGIEFIGADPEEEDRLMQVSESVVFGNFSDLRLKRRAAFLGITLAENLEVRPGNDIYVSMSNRTVKLKVEGLIEKGTVKDSNLVYLSLDTAQELVGQGDVISEVGVKLSDYQDAPALAREIRYRTPYRVESWQDFNREIARFLGTQTRINVIFYGLIFLISGFVVANTTIMIVRRRTKEIGMLMAMGATRRSILKIFLLENLILSPPAGILGVLLGVGFGKAIESYPLDMGASGMGVTKIVLDLRPEFAIYALFFALVLNALSGIYPAYLASGFDPVEAIASE
jgi:lipoprotein-releasing system permease protein